MKLLAGAFFTCVFGCSLLAVTIDRYSVDVRTLRDRLEDSDRLLRRAHDDLETLRLESRGMDARTRTEVDRLRERFAARNVGALYQELLAPSVQVNLRGGVGGGTILFSRPGHTYVITAFHVVQKALRPPEKGEEGGIDVRVYDSRGALEEAVEADLVAHDAQKDLALLRLKTERSYAHPARLATRPAIGTIKVFEPVYAVGCPLGHDPLPTMGEIVTLHKEVNGERFWMMNAPTIFGNSGGGIFHRDTRELIGVSVMVCTYDGVVSTPVPHLGILVSLEVVYDWLDSLHYEFIYDPEATIESCARAREAAAAPGSLEFEEDR